MHRRLRKRVLALLVSFSMVFSILINVAPSAQAASPPLNVTKDFTIQDITSTGYGISEAKGLPDGKTAVLLSKYSSGTTYYLKIYDNSGTLVCSKDVNGLMATRYTSEECHLFPLSNGNIVITYNKSDSSATLVSGSASSPNAYFIVIDQLGNVVTNQTQINSYVEGSSLTRQISMAELTNGNIAFSFQRNDNITTATRIFQTNGTEVTGETVLISGNSYSNAITASTSGTYMTAYSNYNGSAYDFYYKIFNDDGSLVTGSQLSLHGEYSIALYTLANGNFFYGMSKYSAGTTAYLFNASGASQGTMTLSDAVSDGVMAIDRTTGSEGFVIPSYDSASTTGINDAYNNGTDWSGTQYLFLNYYDNSGTLQYTTPATIDSGLVNMVWNEDEYWFDPYAVPSFYLYSGYDEGLGLIKTTYTSDGTQWTISDKLIDISSVAAPTPTTGSAASISSTAATLQGTVNPNGVSTTVTFEYGTSTSYGSTATATQSPVTGSSATTVSCALTDLMPSTTYHYRVKAVSAGGTVYGADNTITTADISAYSVTAAADTLTPSAGANNTVTLTVKNSAGTADTSINTDKTVTISGYAVAPDGSFGSFVGTALTGTSTDVTLTFTNGVATANLKLNKSATQAISFSVSGLVTPASNALSITPTAGTVNALQISKQPVSGAASGDAFVTQPVVTLYDQYGNLCTNGSSATASVTASESTDSSLTGAWTLGGTKTVVASAGVATFTGLTSTLVTLGNAKITFTSGAISADSAAFTIPSKSAMSLTADTTDNSVDNDIVITFASDSAFESAVTGVSFNGLALTSNQYTLSSGTLTLHPNSTDNNYLRTPATGDVIITATGYGASTVSQPITAGVAHSMQISTQPAPGAASGDAFVTQPVVKLYDQYGNLCSDGSSASVSVTAAESSDSSLTGTWVLGGTKTVTASAGVATFAGLSSALDTLGNAKITFISGTLSIDSDEFTLPNHSAVSLTADTTDNSVDNDIQITFTPDSTFEGAITSVSFNGHALTSNQYTIGSGTLALHPCILGNAYLQTPAADYVVITATGYGLSSVAQTITSGAAVGLHVMTQPVSGTTTGDAFSTQPIVGVVDQYGNVCTVGSGASCSITATASSGTGSWALDGTTTVTTSNGVADFSDLTCSLVSSGTGKITFASSTFQVDSAVFTIPERNSAVSATKAAYNKYSGSADNKDISVDIIWNSNTLQAIKNGTATLVLGTDYTVTGNTCAIGKTYLSALATGTTQLIFDFSIGADPVLDITVSDSTPSSGHSSSGNGLSSSGSTIDNTASSVVEVNGVAQSAGTAATATNSNGQTETTVTVNTTQLQNILQLKGDNAVVTIPITTNADVASGVLTGQMVQNMEDKSATLEIRTTTATYVLPASEINIRAVSQNLGTNVSLADVQVKVEISEANNTTVELIESVEKSGSFTLIVPAVDFHISCTYSGKTVEVSKFNSYIERTIAIPNGVDPNKITTGVVVQEDGTVRHVPTRVTQVDGKYYAVINSLTNSIYAVVWHPITFADVGNHWAKDAVNDMGSRMVVTGYKEKNYRPDANITRAEFAAIVVRALGLAQETGTNAFKDVKTSEWYNGYVNTAAEYGVILGFDDGGFHPNATITREQAMVMLARAMKITGINIEMTSQELNSPLVGYTDASSASSYAKRSVGICVKTGVVSGKSKTTLVPQGNITRAEVAVMMQRLLQKSDLI